MLSKQEIASFAILDIEAWATHLEQLLQGIRTYRVNQYIREKAYRSARRFKLDQSNNYRAIRYADVLLMAAEANSRGGIR
jgi:hypothetical protein